MKKSTFALLFVAASTLAIYGGLQLSVEGTSNSQISKDSLHKDSLNKDSLHKDSLGFDVI